MGPSKRLAQWVVEASYEDLPAETVACMKGLLLKTITSMVIGSREPLGRKMLRMYAASGGAPECAVVGAGFRAPVETAAFINGVLAHATETEDAYFFPNNEAVASCWIFPAMLTAGDRLLSSGKDVIAASVFAFEIAARLGLAGPGVGMRNGINTATWFGVPAVAAGASRLLGLDAARAEHAMSIASSQAAGLAEQTGFDAHTIEAGHSCRAGLFSAFLAEAGGTGAPQFIEGGKRIFGPVWEFGGIDFDLITRDLGTAPYLVHKLEFKKYPGCGFLHASVDALQALLAEERLRCEDVELVETEVHSVAGRFCDRPEPQTPGDARFSFQYVFAEIMRCGRVDHTSFRENRRFSDPELRQAEQKVRVIVNEKLPPGYSGARITVRTNDGRTLRKETNAFWGHPLNPMSLEDIRGVLRPFLDAFMIPSLRERVEELVCHLDEQADVRELMALLATFRGA